MLAPVLVEVTVTVAVTQATPARPPTDDDAMLLLQPVAEVTRTATVVVAVQMMKALASQAWRQQWQSCLEHDLLMPRYANCFRPSLSLFPQRMQRAHLFVSCS